MQGLRRLLDHRLRDVLVAAIIVLSSWSVMAWADQTPNLVVLERIVFVGDLGTNESILRSHLELPLGVALERDALDQKLQRAKRRLLFLDFYESVDLAITRGSKRQHFILTVSLKAKSQYYLGLFAHSQRQVPGFGEPKPSEKGGRGRRELCGHGGGVFLGSRTFLGSDARVELQLSKSEETETTPSQGQRTVSNDHSANLNLFHPRLMNTPVFGLLRFSMENSRQLGQFGLNGSDGESSYASSSRLRMLLLESGIRWQLLRISALFARAHYYFDEKLELYLSYAGANVEYTNKSNLFLVEPGIDLSLRYARVTAAEYWHPSLMGRALYTFQAPHNLAFTPGWMTDITHFDDEKYENGASTKIKRIERRHQISLKTELVTAYRNVLGLEVGLIESPDANENWGEMRTDRFAVLSYRDLGDLHLLFEFSFIYGQPMEDYFSDQDPRRLSR